MLQLGTNIKVADNTGARSLRCIHVMGGNKKRYAFLGEIVVGVIKEAEPRKQVAKHQVVRAVIIRQKKETRRLDGSYIRFDDNACVILEAKTIEPKGGRIFGPVARELREKGFEKVASLAEELV